MALFESYERRIDQINSVLNSYGIASIEEAEKITKEINALRVSLIGILLSSMPFLNDELKLNLPVHWINCVED